MEPSDFAHYNLRVDLDLILRYEGLGLSVTRVVHRLAHHEAHPTVVHVHFNLPLDRKDVPGEEVTFYEMPGLVGLGDCTLNRKVLFTTEIAESYIIDRNGRSLRRLDIHYNEGRPRNQSGD